MGVYLNWAKLDPWFTLRMLFHLWHPNSPLSHPALTRRAFFGSAFPDDRVLPFQRQLCRYESFWWPLTMMRPFATANAVLGGIDSAAVAKVLVMAGDEDALMAPEVTLHTAAFYRSASNDDNVRVEFVKGAGHHLQNDVQWREGADRLLDWYKGLA